MNKEIEEATQLVTAMQDKTESNITPYDPVADVESTLSSFLKNRLKKLEEDIEFEREVKDNLLARMPEAEFGALAALLGSLQTRTNDAVSTILSPFIPKAQEASMERKKRDNLPEEERIYNNADKSLLEAFNELFQMLQTKNKQSPEQKDQAEDIKAKLVSE